MGPGPHASRTDREGAVEFGIDFGTTRTVVACADRGNHPVVAFQDASGDTIPWIPSIVAERDGELRFGLDALALAASGSGRVVRSFKRLLSNAGAGPEHTVRIGGTEIGLGDLVAGFVAHVRDALVTRSDARRSLSRGSLRAAVAVPANAHSAQRLITLDAFRRAGFESVAMLNEPSAAGFEYTHRHRDTLVEARRRPGVRPRRWNVRRLGRANERPAARGAGLRRNRPPGRRRLRQRPGRRDPRTGRARTERPRGCAAIGGSSSSVAPRRSR